MHIKIVGMATGNINTSMKNHVYIFPDSQQFLICENPPDSVHFVFSESFVPDAVSGGTCFSDVPFVSNLEVSMCDFATPANMSAPGPGPGPPQCTSPEKGMDCKGFHKASVDSSFSPCLSRNGQGVSKFDYVHALFNLHHFACSHSADLHAAQLLELAMASLDIGPTIGMLQALCHLSAYVGLSV